MNQPNENSGPRKMARPQTATSPAPRAREKQLERVKKVIEQATDVRQERVEAAKLVLKEGKLKLKGNVLAEKIVADALNQKSIYELIKVDKTAGYLNLAGLARR